MLRQRLRLPVLASDEACPLCDGVNDRMGDHARVCPCGGDRVKRHNRLRSLLAARAQAAGLNPEVEKPGLLPPRPCEAGAPEDGGRGAGGRRPADVWVGSWGAHGPAAFDLAVTSGLQQGNLRIVTNDGSKPVEDYEARKRTYQNTQAVCSASGFQFIPLVVEACGGGWAPAAVKAWKDLALALSTSSGDGASQEAERLYQALGITLHRENARAVLRRATPATPVAPPLLDP